MMRLRLRSGSGIGTDAGSASLNVLKKDAKDSKMPEDEQKGIEGAIQKVTDANIAAIDRLIEKKQTEITTV